MSGGTKANAKWLDAMDVDAGDILPEDYPCTQ